MKKFSRNAAKFAKKRNIPKAKQLAYSASQPVMPKADSLRRAGRQVGVMKKKGSLAASGSERTACLRCGHAQACMHSSGIVVGFKKGVVVGGVNY